MDLTNQSIVKQLQELRAELTETKLELTEAKVKLEQQSNLRVGEQIKAAVARAEEGMQSEFEELRTALSRSEEKSKDRIEKLEAAVAEAQKNEDVGPRNLVVCIDGTANQFGVKVRH